MNVKKIIKFIKDSLKKNVYGTDMEVQQMSGKYANWTDIFLHNSHIRF